MLSLILALMLQGPPTQTECEADGGYFKDAGQVCLERDDMNEDQVLLLRTLCKYEQDLAQALHTQQEFDAGSVVARKAAFDSRIAELVVERDATSGMPAQMYQDQIDRLTKRRDQLDSTAPGSPRDLASQLGPVITQLNLDISELKTDLDASIL